MSNITQEELADAIATTIEEIEGAGTCITDKKFSQSTAELPRLLRSLTDGGEAVGTVLSWEGLPAQEEDGTCDVLTTYAYRLLLLHPYDNDTDGETSEAKFKRRIYLLNEFLNARRDLGLGSCVQHQFLTSTAEFGVLIDEGQASESALAHIAEFDLFVQVLNRY